MIPRSIVDTPQGMWQEPVDFPPEVELIRKVKEAYVGNYTVETRVKSGIGGTVFAITQLMREFIALSRKPVLDPNGLLLPEERAFLSAWMAPDTRLHRPAWIELFSDSVGEALLSGFICFERYHQGLDAFLDVRDIYLGFSEERAVPEIPCTTVLPRPSENFLIGRDQKTGIMYEAPFWYIVDIARYRHPGSYVGPFHRNQFVYGALHKLQYTDFYGHSLFGPLYAEIKGIGQAFQVAEKTGRQVMKPNLSVGLLPGMSKTEVENAIAQINEHIDKADQSDYDQALVVSGGINFDYTKPNVDFSDISTYMKDLIALVEKWLGIPESLWFSRANKSNTETQSQLFSQKMNAYRNQIYSWWETHFKLLLVEGGYITWDQFDTTRVEMDWEVERDVWQSIDDTGREAFERLPETLQGNIEQVIEGGGF